MLTCYFQRASSSHREILAVNPAWLAPEATIQRRLTLQTDVYAYGIMLWELITRQHPFSEYKQLFTRAIIEGRRPTIPSNCPQLYATLIEACWQSEPEKRYKKTPLNRGAAALSLIREEEAKWIPRCFRIINICVNLHALHKCNHLIFHMHTCAPLF